MRDWKKIGVAALLFVCIALHAASAEGIEVGGGAGIGKGGSAVGELYLNRVFAPFASWDDWSLRLQVGLSGMIWTDENDTLGAAFAGVGPVLDMPGGDSWRPYVAVTVAAGVISENTFSGRHLGGPFLFRDSLALGLRFGDELRHNLAVVGSHYSNAGLYDRNQGFNSLELTYGYMF